MLILFFLNIFIDPSITLIIILTITDINYSFYIFNGYKFILGFITNLLFK